MSHTLWHYTPRLQQWSVVYVANSIYAGFDCMMQVHYRPSLYEDMYATFPNVSAAAV